MDCLGLESLSMWRRTVSCKVDRVKGMEGNRQPIGMQTGTDGWRNSWEQGIMRAGIVLGQRS